jgi:hypothetical protein
MSDQTEPRKAQESSSPAHASKIGIPSVSLSRRLARADELFSRGEQWPALSELWQAEAEARRNPQALQELLTVAEGYQGLMERSSDEASLRTLLRVLHQHLDAASKGRAAPAPGHATREAPGGLFEIVSSLAGTFVLYALIALLSANNSSITLNEWLIWSGIVAACWISLAVLQVRWWRAGKPGYWRPPFFWPLMGLLAISWIGLLSLLIPRWRRWLFRGLTPNG